MKVIFTENECPDDNFVSITSLSIADIMVEDSEANEIIVDDFLSQYNYDNVGKALNKIISKLRLDGSITVIQCDVDFICYQLAKGMIDVKRFNELCFSRPASSMISMEIICDLLEAGGVKIVSKTIGNFCNAIIKGVRSA